MSEEEGIYFKTDSPADCQCVRVKYIIQREAWDVPYNKYITLIGRANQDDEKTEPVQWSPLREFNPIMRNFFKAKNLSKKKFHKKRFKHRDLRRGCCCRYCLYGNNYRKWLGHQKYGFTVFWNDDE